jgi:predicted PurR-regulated permease PerM
MSELKPAEPSPRWGATTKTVVAITITAVVALLLYRFRGLIGPVVLAFLLAYLLYPLAKHIGNWLHLKWGLVVTLLYLIVIIVLLGLITLGGLAIFDQTSSLISFLQNALVTIPDFISNIQHTVIHIGRFEFDTAQYDFSQISTQAMTLAQNILKELGTLVGVIASGAAEVVSSIVFMLLISYFILLETGGVPGKLFSFNVPVYGSDITKMKRQLGSIWNTFLRGQILIIFITIIIYIVILGTLGVRYFLGLALLAGMARFVPYVGPFIAWTTYFLVGYFQPYHPFGLQPFAYAIMIVAIALVTDAIIDNFVSTRILARVLKVHPAAVLIAALVGASLFGLIGVVLASPVMATMKLIMIYIMQKLFDLDPWQRIDLEESMPPRKTTVERVREMWAAIRKFFLRILFKIRKLTQTRTDQP